MGSTNSPLFITGDADLRDATSWFQEVMGLQPPSQSCLPTGFANPTRPWTEISIPSEIVPALLPSGSPGDDNRNYFIDKVDGSLKSWTTGTRVIRPAHPSSIMKKAQEKSTRSTWGSRYAGYLTKLLLESHLSLEEFSLVHRVPLAVLTRVIDSPQFVSLTKGRADDAHAKLIDRFRNYRSELLKAWSVRHAEFQQLYAPQFAFMAGNEDQPAVAENAQDNEDVTTTNDGGTTTTVPTEVYQALLRLADRQRTSSSVKLDYKGRKFTGDDADKWFSFKKRIISFMNLSSISRDDLAGFARSYRVDSTFRPPNLVCESLNNYLGAHLEGTALDLVGQETNGFLKYMRLIERFEHLRMSRFIKITEQLYSGVTYDNNVDKLFREYQDLNLMLKDFKAELDPRLMIALILRSLPESFLSAKSVIGLREDCTLEEARAIIQTHSDQLHAQFSSSSGPKLALSSISNQGRRTRNNFPKTPGSQCTKCGFKNHTAGQCMKTKGYKCKHCGGNHLERVCKSKSSVQPMAMCVWRTLDWLDETRSSPQPAFSVTILALVDVVREKLRRIKFKPRKIPADENDWVRCTTGWRLRSAVRSELTGDRLRIQHIRSNRRRVPRRHRHRHRPGAHHFAAIAVHHSKSDRSRQLEFVVDSGATCHIVNDRSWFTSYAPFPAGHPGVTVANGSELPIPGHGTVACIEAILSGVNHCPQARVNLLSVPRLVSLGWTVSFKGNICEISKDGTTLTARKIRGMYRLYLTRPEEIAHLAKTKSTKRTSALLHRRMGHPGSHLDIDKWTVGPTAAFVPERCTSCVEGKQFKLAARSSYQGCEDRREVTTYADFFGPFKPGLHGHRHYLFFLHYSSRYLSVFPMADKSGAELAFQVLANRHKDFDVLQCDRDGVFISSNFHTRVAINDVQLRYTTPHRHEFQGAVERVIRTIADKARCLIADSGLDKDKFWPYAITTAVYLYNRTPIGNGPSPYERRNGRKPDISNLRVWGCKVKVLDPNVYPKNKPRTYDGIFVGYPSYTFSHGTYSIYKPSTNTVIQSRDVHFFEEAKPSGGDSDVVDIEVDSSTRPISDLEVSATTESGQGSAQFR